VSKAQINRFEWLKAVMQCADLNATAKNLASAMAVQFANDETGQLNPSVETLADYLKTSTDSIKRAVRALVDGGWLDRTEGRGRGNRTVYRLLSPGKIVAFRPAKQATEPAPEKGATPHLQPKEKGANLHGKGGKSAPSYIEQSLEQKTRPRDRFADHTFVGNFTSGVQLLSKADHWAALNAWGEWLARMGLPKLCQLPIAEEAKRGTVFCLPYRRPPSDEAQTSEAFAYFTTLLEAEASRHAAQ
jgi:DNA-binding MarR family transcriptional regulator